MSDTTKDADPAVEATAPAQAADAERLRRTPTPRRSNVSPATESRAEARVIPLRPAPTPIVSFDRRELSAILSLYGKKVASGEWRDYALDFGRDRAVFSIFRRSGETALYRIEKDPRLARKQGVYAVVALGGRVMKRGHDLARVLAVLDRKLSLVPG